MTSERRMETQAKCAHHWRIETPNGPTAAGRCKKCGEEKAFPNHADYALGGNAMREVGQYTGGWW